MENINTRFIITNKVQGFYYIEDVKTGEFTNEMFCTKKDCKEFIKELEQLTDKQIYLEKRYFQLPCDWYTNEKYIK